MASSTTPILLLTGLSFANKWYTTNQIDLKIPVAGGVAAVLAALFSDIPGAAPIVTGIAWVALVAAVVVPNNSILNPLLNLANGK